MARRCIIFKAITVRFLFVLHISLCLWRVYEEYNQQLGWWLIFGSAVFLLSIEAAVTICCNKQGEWTKFIPSILIYLVGTVPTLCLIEWEMLKRRLEYEKNVGTCPSYAANATAINIGDGVEKVSYEWSLALQQSLVILLVAGRWFLPKGKTSSRDNLFCLLLAHIGMSADILEFLSEGLQTDTIRCDKTVIIPIICLWALSLLQFAFELNFTGQERAKSLSRIHETLSQRFNNSEGRGIILVILLQDFPFLCMRLYLIANYRMLEQGLIFSHSKIF
ncbi:transmembrane protein 26-like [Amphiura filiformis]|uniref:transmembrane protein 26-like n=1 Tax=Amphiura filiformis TaxID=82378 RepID=UPI003B221109